MWKEIMQNKTKGQKAEEPYQRTTAALRRILAAAPRSSCRCTALGLCTWLPRLSVGAEKAEGKFKFLGKNLSAAPPLHQVQFLSLPILWWVPRTGETPCWGCSGKSPGEVCTGTARMQSTSNSEVSRLAFLEYLRKSCKESGEKGTVRVVRTTVLNFLIAYVTQGTGLRAVVLFSHWILRSTTRRYPDGKATPNLMAPASLQDGCLSLNVHPGPKFHVVLSLVVFSNLNQFRVITKPPEWDMQGIKM